MNSDMKLEPRVRILQAAAELFARRGYGLVGVREIAGLAEVNVAMISYYFEGKIGILHTIIDTFFDLYFKLVEKEYDPEMTPEESIRHLVALSIGFMRQHEDEALVMFNQLPIDEPEIQDLKVQRIRQLFVAMDGLISRFSMNPTARKRTIAILGPAIINTLYSHLLLHPLSAGFFKIEKDDLFYQEYIKLITEFVLGGIRSVQNYILREE